MKITKNTMLFVIPTTCRRILFKENSQAARIYHGGIYTVYTARFCLPSHIARDKQQAARRVSFSHQLFVCKDLQKMIHIYYKRKQYVVVSVLLPPLPLNPNKIHFDGRSFHHRSESIHCHFSSQELYLQQAKIGLMLNYYIC